MSVVRKFLPQPVPQLTPPWQRVQSACPEHPDCSMRKVQVLGRWLWECSHPSHITGEIPTQQGTGGLLISPIRARAMTHTDTWRDIPPPLYVLPAPQSTGAMRPVVPVPAPVEREAPRERPEWVQAIVRLSDQSKQRAELQDVTPADCEPDLEETGGQITEQAPALTLLRYMQRKGVH